MKCVRCGKECERDEIHIFNGGEERRRKVEECFKTKVSLCSETIIYEEVKDGWYEI